jgi:transposase
LAAGRDLVVPDCRQWREKLLEGGREALAGKEERQGERELRRKVAELERALGRKTYELEIAGKLLREWG